MPVLTDNCPSPVDREILNHWANDAEGYQMLPPAIVAHLEQCRECTQRAIGCFNNALHNGRLSSEASEGKARLLWRCARAHGGRGHQPPPFPTPPEREG